MIQMITANKARAKTEFAMSVNEYISYFNQGIEEEARKGRVSMIVEMFKDMNIGQWKLFIDMIEQAGYRIVDLHAGKIEVYWSWKSIALRFACGHPIEKQLRIGSAADYLIMIMKIFRSSFGLSMM